MYSRRPLQRAAGFQKLFNPSSFLTAVLAGLTLAACRDAPTAPVETDADASLAVAVGTWTRRADYPRQIWETTSASITDPSTQRTIIYVI